MQQMPPASSKKEQGHRSSRADPRLDEECLEIARAAVERIANESRPDKGLMGDPR